MVSSALDQLGRPYEFAGATPKGFDCSGLVDFVFAGNGVSLPRTSSQQAAVGQWVAMDEVLPGDLVFFSADGDVIDHVGVVVSRPGEPLEMVHASTSRGVVQTRVTESRYWMGRLRFARRVLD